MGAAGGDGVKAPAFVITALQIFGLITLLYFLILNSLYLIFSIIAFIRLRQHRRRWTSRELDAVIRSPATPGMSLLVPAFNEAGTIGESVRALLVLNYPRFEVIVVNDGSTDRTWERILEAKKRWPQLYAIHLGRNYGKRAAMGKEMW